MNKITKIEIATGGCFGPCHYTATSIDSTLAYNFYGGKVPFLSPAEDTLQHGFYQGRINRNFWDTLNVKLENIHYQQLDSLYQHTVDDQTLEVIIYHKGKMKHIWAQSASFPDTVANVLYWIANSYKSVKLIQIKDSITFNTKEQYGYPAPINVKDIKFPPPKRNQ